MTDKIKSLGSALEEYSASREGTVTIKYDESLSRHTTFRIGGNADLYLIPHSVDSLVDVIRIVRDSGVKFYILGNGSNVLFDDAGFSGVVISMSGLTNVKVDGDVITADAGATLASVCKAARDGSLEGLEFAYGIPGSVFDINAVQRIAYDMNFHELVIYLEDNRKEYVNFILYGDR